MKASDRGFKALAVATVQREMRPRNALDSSNIEVIRRRVVTDLIATLEVGAVTSNDARTERRRCHVTRLLRHAGSEIDSSKRVPGLLYDGR